MKKDNLIIAKKKFKSRLIVGTGKYRNMKECAKAIKLSGAEIVTVAVRRVNISAPDNLIALAHSDIVLYFPVPTINLDLKFFLAMMRLSFFILPSSYKMNNLNFVVLF